MVPARARALRWSRDHEPQPHRALDRSSPHGIFGWCGVDDVITVPDASDVAVRSGSGGISVTGSFGGVTINAGSGDVSVAVPQGATCDVEPQPGSGDSDVDYR